MWYQSDSSAAIDTQSCIGKKVLLEFYSKLENKRSRENKFYNLDAQFDFLYITCQI